MAKRPFAWEKSYPPGLRWDVPLEPSTLPALLDAAVAAYGGATAIEYRGRDIAFSELGAQSRRFAVALLASGVMPGSAVALYLPNTPYHPLALFGIARAGCRAVHLSPLDAERILAHKLADSGARVVVTTNVGAMADVAVRLSGDGLLDRVIVGDDAAWGPAPAPLCAVPAHEAVTGWSAFVTEAAENTDWPAVAPDDIALLQYTGGTTGLPKGAILSHANLTCAVASYDAWFSGQRFAAPGEERVICVLPLFHIYALTTILLRHLKNGNRILLRQRFDVQATLADIEERRATSFPGVPTMWIALAAVADIETRDLSSLSYCASGGAPLPVEVAERFTRLTGKRLLGGWGMTETSPAGTNIPRAGPDKPGSIGLPLPGIEMDVVVLDDAARRLSPGEIGELRIKGPNVTRGYWNRPQDTRAAFVDGYFLTGDIGLMDEDGYFFLVDRKTDMIISGGFNIYPQMIEQALYEHPQVEEALVVGVPDCYRGEAVKAFVKLRAGAPGLSLEELQDFLKNRLGPHEMPRILEVRDSLPRTPVGKLSKLELREEERAKSKTETRLHPAG